MEKIYQPGTGVLELPPRPETSRWKHRVFGGLPLYLALPIFLLVTIGFIIGITLGLVTVSKNKSASIAHIAANSGIAVSGLAIKDSAQWATHLFYQNADNQIRFHIGVDGARWPAPQILDLKIAPDVQTPMAATSIPGDGNAAFVQLYYMTHGDIAWANISCPEVSAASCKVMSNTISTSLKVLKYPISANSSIAAVALSGKEQHVYYHNSDRDVTQLSFINGAWDAGTVIAGKVFPGSSLAAVKFSSAQDIQLLYVDGTTNSISSVQSLDKVWQKSKPLTDKPPITFTPLSAVSLAYTSATDSLHAFFSGLTLATSQTTIAKTSSIYEHVGKNATSASFSTAASTNDSGITTVGWTQTPVHNMSWVDGFSFAGLSTQGPGGADQMLMKESVASLGWGSQIRFYQRINGSMFETRGDWLKETWSVARIV